jgi:calnexin
MQNDILFDNIYIGTSPADAAKLAEETWAVKNAVEKALEQAEQKKEEEKKPKSPSELSFKDDPVTYIKEKVDLFLTIAQKDPIQAVKFVPEVAGGIAAILVSLIAVIAVGVGGSSAPAGKKAVVDAKEKAKDAKEKVAASGVDTGKGEATKRNTRSQS